jgi:hypothetical protein
MAKLCLLILARYYGDALLVNPDKKIWRRSACQSWPDTMAKLRLTILARYYGKTQLVNPGICYGEAQLVSLGKILGQNPAY